MSRSCWKLPFFHSCFFRLTSSKKFRIIITTSRSSQICNHFRKRHFGIHNGLGFKPTQIQPEMLLLKFGEFSITRRAASGIVMHRIKNTKEAK
jgi:ribosomal protein S19